MIVMMSMLEKRMISSTKKMIYLVLTNLQDIPIFEARNHGFP